MTGRFDWRPGGLLATTVVAIGGAAAVAFVTIDALPLPTRRAKAPAVASMPAAPVARAVDVQVPSAEPPPEPTASDFTAKPVDPPAPPPPPAPAAPEPTGLAAPADPPIPPPPPEGARTKPVTAADWAALATDEVRRRANADDATAMEELARRLIQGAGVAKDPQAGAGWLLRAAAAGSAQAAFNVGVMYERGFVVERDSTRAVEWYRKASDGNVPAAKHNLALLLRDGKGAPRDVKRAIELLQSAALQGMAASMFSLGDVYERGDSGAVDNAMALAWFAIAAEFERQVNHGEETPLAKTAEQRSQALQRVLTPAELQRAQQVGQSEYRTIAEALAPKPQASTTDPQAAPASVVDLPSWPKEPADQVRAIQQALVDLRLLRDKPDGLLGPLTRTAIRDFQRSIGVAETGEPSKEVYVALRQVQAKREVEASSPLPPPAKTGD